MERDLNELRKALDVSAAGDKLLQPLVDKVLQDLLAKDWPLWNNIPKKPGSGKEWIIVKRSARPEGHWVNDTEEPTRGQSTYEPWVTFPFKSVLVPCSISRKLIATGKSYIDIKTEEINAALDTIRNDIEDATINGDASSNVKEFSGLRKLVPSGQRLELGTGNGGPITLEALDAAIDLCFGLPDGLICSKRTRREINALLQANQRYVDTKEVKGGFKLNAYSNIAIYPSDKISDTQTVGGSDNASDLFIVNTTKVWYGILTNVTSKVLAQATSQLEPFDVYGDLVLVLANEKYVSRILGIVPPT